MKTTAHIKQSQILDGNTAMVDAVITSTSRVLAAGVAAIALQEATGHNLVVIAGTEKVLEQTPFRTTVRAMMSVAAEAIPFQDGMDGFTSISSDSNIYMDKSEKIWSLRQSESGKTLVRSHVIDDQDEIQQLLQACSNVTEQTANTRDREFFQTVSAVAPIHTKSADVVSFAYNGVLGFGIVVTAHTDEQHMPLDSMTVLPYESDSAVTMGSANILHNFGDLINSESNTEGYAEPEGDFISASNVENLVSYWKKVYGHNATFWTAFESRIRNHQFS